MLAKEPRSARDQNKHRNKGFEHLQATDPHLGRHLLVGGSVQMLLVSVPVAWLLNWNGFSWQTSALLGAAVAFSSTVLVFKTLSEWGRSSSSSGRRAIGILLFQDVALIPLLLVIPLIAGQNDQPGTTEYLALATKSLLFVSSVTLMRWGLSRWLIPALTSFRSPDVVVLASIVILGGVTLASYRMGLPPAVGAFAAGLMLNGNRWTEQIDALVLPFRETFTAIFFVSLGMLLEPKTVIQQPVFFLVGLTSLIIIKAVAATIALRLTALPLSLSIRMGFGLAHVGEFAFAIVTIALKEGLVPEEKAQQFVAISLVSLMLSPILLTLALRGRDTAQKQIEKEQPIREIKSRNAIVIGMGPIGRQLASQLETSGYDACLIDRSPLNLQQFAQQGFRTIVGDATDPGTLERANADQVGIVVISIAVDSEAVAVVRELRQVNRSCEVFVRCRFQSNVQPLKNLGVRYVVSEETQALDAMSQLLLTAFSRA